MTVYEPQQERAHSARSMMSLDEQWHMIKDNHLMMIARSVASPHPGKLQLLADFAAPVDQPGEVLEEHAFRSGWRSLSFTCAGPPYI